MAIARDNYAVQNIPANTTSTFSYTTSGTNRYLLILTETYCDTVTYNSTALTLLTTWTPPDRGSGPAPAMKVWGLGNPTTGSNTISIRNTDTSLRSTPVIISYTGADPIQPNSTALVEDGLTSGFATQLNATLNTITDNSWLTYFVVAGSSWGATMNVTAGTSTTFLIESAYQNARCAVLDSNAAKTPTGSYTLSANTSQQSRISGVMLEIKPYLTATFTGPSSGNVNSASTNFTVTPDVAINGSITITPTGAGSSGLSPTVLTFSNSAVAQTFTITPLTSGSITLTVTNSVGLNNPAALTYTANAVVPTVPGIGTAVPNNAQAYVAFTAPSSDGGATITGYTATSTPGSFTGTGTTSPITVTGLTNGTGYTFTVHATNSVGNSSESSASNSVTPYVAATSFTLTGPSTGNVRSASTNFIVTPDAIFDGTITITPTGVGSTGLDPVVLTFAHTSTAQTFTITPIESGAITLTPTNSGTLSNPANLTYTASAVVPLAPTIGYVAPDINSLRVSIIAPTNDGGSDITMYTVTCSNGTVQAPSSAGELTFSNLTPGTNYTFYASATNAVGTSSNSSTTSAATPLTVEARFYNNGPKFDLTPGVGNVLSF